MPLRSLFLDMNSYFASVEQQFRPELRGRPVAVAPLRADTTCCIAASYEAKRFGVKTGTVVRDARRLCPGIVFVEARPELYIRTHHKIIEAVKSCYPVEAVLSIDEMCCRLTGIEQDEEVALDLARRIKQTIYDNVGRYLRCSIGLAPNRLLAKVASDMQKPDGLTVIRQEDLPARLHELNLRDFSGIGPRMEARFHRAGVRTVEHLCRLTIDELSRIWGSRLLGEIWWRHLRGEEVSPRATHRRSIGHSRVLAPQLRNPVDSWKMLERLLAKAALRLRKSGLWSARLAVSIKYLGAPSWKMERRFSPCQDTLSFLRHLRLISIPPSRATPLKVGVVLSDLTADRSQTKSLFEENQRLGALSQAMDTIQHRFGQQSIEFASMQGRESKIPMRIAFTRIPELDLYDHSPEENELLQ